ncbi:SHOCT domain-containing protein [Streptomyces sp. NPDC056387]|uniref:SHOCT domain-containing protein n=1 Tax=Streptomyces sp. NPDC056387 TaxID=3345803 RepID=UPI0035D65759
MFIRPIGTRVEPARRPSGHPLLAGLLSRAAGHPPGPPPPQTPQTPQAEPAEPAPGAEARPAARPGGTTGGLAAELAQLAELAREGVLTPQEFKEAKTRLLHP